MNSRLFCCRLSCLMAVCSWQMNIFVMASLLSTSITLIRDTLLLFHVRISRSILLLFCGIPLVSISYYSHPSTIPIFAEHPGIYFAHCTHFPYFVSNSPIFATFLLPAVLWQVHDFSFQLTVPYSSFSTAQLITFSFFPTLIIFSSYFLFSKSPFFFIFIFELWFFQSIFVTDQIIYTLFSVIMDRLISIYLVCILYMRGYMLLGSRICLRYSSFL